MKPRPHGICTFALLACASAVHASDPPQTTTLAPVTVHASDTQVSETPAVSVRLTRTRLAQQNVTGSADVLRFAPNLQVRSRYIGDPNAIISGRNAGTLQSARSLVYANGLLLSNLMTNGWDGAPRWGMVTPEEIGAVDVLYGPYSALYPGNSIGTTVLIHTRLPQRLTASASVQWMDQDFHDAYGAGGHYLGHRAAASLGDRQGRWSWLLSVDRLDNHGQPMQYASARAGGDAGSAVAVSGATLDRTPTGSPRLIYGANSIEHTIQSQAKLKLGVHLTDTVSALVTLGWWHDDAQDRTRSFLRDAAGAAVSAGTIGAYGRRWTLPASGLAPTASEGTHLLYGAELSGKAGDTWRWTAVASHYDFARAQARTADLPAPAGPQAGAGTVADNAGSGWDTFDLRSSGAVGEAHMLYAGLHGDRYVLDSQVHTADDWRGPADGPRASAFAGRTQTRAGYLQDVYSFASDWALTLGARWEEWRAYGGLRADATTTAHYADRQRSDLSPKAALAWDFAPDWQLRLAYGKAVRYPTVGELFQGTISANAIVGNDPDLKPEQDNSLDLTLVRQLTGGHWRVSLFQDRIADALYTQTDITVSPSVTSVQNIDRTRMRGVEGELVLTDVWTSGLDLSASLALNDATTRHDRRYPLADGKWFPRIPRVRASVFADYRFAPGWDASLGVRRSGRQFGTLDNSDRLDTYGAVSAFTVADAKLRWQFAPRWTASLGVDNFTNARYWVYHPYAGRTWVGDVRWDL